MDKKELIEWFNENVFTINKESKDTSWDMTVQKDAEMFINSIINKTGECFSDVVFAELRQLFDEVITKTEEFLIKNNVPIQKDKPNYNRSICQLFLWKVLKAFEYNGKKIVNCPKCNQPKEFDLTKVPVGEKFEYMCDKCGIKHYIKL